MPIGNQIHQASKETVTSSRFPVAGKNAAFALYEDEGTNYNYEKGFYTNLPITWNEASKTLTIGKRTGNYAGMLDQRTFNIVWISRTNALSVGNKDNKPAVTIQYLGEQQSLTMK